MLVLVAATRNHCVPWLCGLTGGSVGMMYSPDSDKPRPYPWMPLAIDNGRFHATVSGRDWEERAFLKLIDFVLESDCKPLFVAVPDVVYDREATLREWDKWFPRLDKLDVPLAMVVQDGMTPEDVPEGMVAFIGGSKVFKRRMTPNFIDTCSRVHVGRVNRYKALCRYEALGAASVDGSGFFRGGYGAEAYRQLEMFLFHSTPQMELFDPAK